MRKERLVNFQNIAPGQVAILTLPLGPTYEKLKVNLLGAGFVISQIDQIVGKINDRPFFTVSGADLLAENLYEGRANPTNLIVLDFLRGNAKSSSSHAGATSQVAEQMVTCIPSALMQKLTFEFTINAAAPAGCNMQAFAQLNNPSKNPLVLKQLYSAIAFPYAQDNDIPLAVGLAGSIIKKLFVHQSNYGTPWTVSTAFALNALMTANGNLYKCTTAGTTAATGTGPAGTGTGIADGTAVWAYVSPAGSIQYMQVRNAGVIIWEGAPADAAGDQTDYQKVQQPGLTVVDFDLQGFREKWLNTALTNNVFLRLTTTNGPFNMRLYQSIVDPVSR